MNTERIEARIVPEDARLSILPRHFGQKMQIVEDRIYDFMRMFSSTYQGGWWQFYELSNGGFYMSPPEAVYDVSIPGNGFSGQMSADAAGITVCLFTFSHLSFEYPDAMWVEHFYWLGSFAGDHAEASLIFEAID